MWKEIWIIMLVLAFICLVGSILLVFLWDIPSLIDELSGRKAKRQIKMLHDLNSNTSSFDRLSTNEIYSSISSGTLLNEELNNIDRDEVGDYSNNELVEDVEEDSTSYLSNENIEEDSTSFMEMDDEESTSYLSNEDVEEDSTSYLGSEDSDSTSFLGVDDEYSTSYLDMEVEKNAISNTSIRKITIIEEQSSL